MVLEKVKEQETLCVKQSQINQQPTCLRAVLIAIWITKQHKYEIVTNIT